MDTRTPSDIEEALAQRRDELAHAADPQPGSVRPAVAIILIGAAFLILIGAAFLVLIISIVRAAVAGP